MHRKHGNVTTIGFIRLYTKQCCQVDLKLNGIIESNYQGTSACIRAWDM